MDPIEQAVAALTNRENFAPDAAPMARSWQVDMGAVLRALEHEGIAGHDARRAVVGALRQIGGEIVRERLNRSRLRDGRVAVAREDYHEVWYVPVSAVRPAPQSSSGNSGAGPAE